MSSLFDCLCLRCWFRRRRAASCGRRRHATTVCVCCQCACAWRGTEGDRAARATDVERERSGDDGTTTWGAAEKEEKRVVVDLTKRRCAATCPFVPPPAALACSRPRSLLLGGRPFHLAGPCLVLDETWTIGGGKGFIPNPMKP